ncbi:unnamed protein product [Brassicogethes aeneus]|uniref:Laminin G domain-containing protein n=1 Tax=Brassicogethes aeneus TaxID=1431903 RepID=A0A9P0AU54_BRAAE|nr:unnamed protein product [Brassicogethes aeneus]
MRSLVVIFASICFCHGFLLDGSTNSYSQFRKWGGGTNGSLEFEFKTDQPNGLLLYTDDGGTYDFFEIKLVEGALRNKRTLGIPRNVFDMSLSLAAVIKNWDDRIHKLQNTTILGRSLNDGHWHKVHVQRHEERTILTVDGVNQMRTSRGKEFNFGRFSTNSDVFVGGMPTWYNTKLTLLALPSVIFEPRYLGSVRNLIYPDVEGGAPRRQETRPKDHRVSFKLFWYAHSRNYIQDGKLFLKGF